jgi:hypothetical protein
MFKCAITGKTSKAREPMTKVVTATRPKTYLNHKMDPDTLEWEEVHSTGYETVSEIPVSAEGMKILQDEDRRHEFGV